MRLAAVMLAAGAVAACAVGSDAHIGSMISAGELRVDPDATDPSRFIVTIRSNAWAPAYDQRDMQQRIVNNALSRHCGAPEIESARVTEFGTTPIGVPMRLHTLQVRCDGAAPSAAGREAVR